MAQRTQVTLVSSALRVMESTEEEGRLKACGEHAQIEPTSPSAYSCFFCIII